MKDKKKFGQYMTALSETFDKEISTVLSKVYWNALDQYTDEQFENAVNTAIVKCKFFPKPAELIELVSGDQGERSLLAWEKVRKAIVGVGAYQSVQFDDPAIHSCIELMGGWPELCMTRQDELKWKQKEFESAYRVMSKQRNHPEKLCGIVEVQNNARGFIREIPAPVMIGERGKIKQLESPKANLKAIK